MRFRVELDDDAYMDVNCEKPPSPEAMEALLELGAAVLRRMESEAEVKPVPRPLPGQPPRG